MLGVVAPRSRLPEPALLRIEGEEDIEERVYWTDELVVATHPILREGALDGVTQNREQTGVG